MSQEICPCCKRKIPSKRSAMVMDKRLAQDLIKAEAAIAICESALTNPWYGNIRDAVEMEKTRLVRMLTDWRMLWACYRRRDKGEPYYQM